MTDTLLVGGAVWGHEGCDALRIRGGRVVWIGAAEEDGANAGDHRIDLSGMVVLPGFIDAHTHLVQTGLVETGWRTDLANLTREETLAALAAAARTRGEQRWVIASGWDEAAWLDRRLLTRADLDTACADTPLLAVRIDGHLGVVNTLGLRTALERNRTGAAACCVDAGRGHLREEALWALLRSLEPDKRAVEDAIRAAAKLCHRHGVTAVHVMAPLDQAECLFSLASSVQLRMVVHAPIERLDDLLGDGLCTGTGDDWARWGGVKLFADGSVGARNAAMSTPYRDGGIGQLNHPPETLRRWIARADRNGWQTLTHAIGDRAIGTVLDAHLDVKSDPALRHRIEHFEFPMPEQIQRAREAGICVCMQPNFIGNWSGPDSLYAHALGPERDAAGNPFRAILDAGIVVGFGSDGMPIGPLYGIHCVTRAPYPGQRISLREAIACYSSGSGSLSTDGQMLGQIAVGRPADLTIIDGPVDDGGAADVQQASVVCTFVQGRLVYTRMEGE